MRISFIGVVAFAASLLVSGCSNEELPVALSPTAAEGRDIAEARGCVSCHGGDFDGGVAPSLVGVFGTEVPLVEGGMVIADRAYLVESIVEPNAKRRLGTALQMPKVALTDVEVERIVDYLVELRTAS